MASFTVRVKQRAADLLRRTGTPESQLTARMKSVGAYMILVSTLAIVPLVILDNVPVAITIILQLVYAALMCVGLTLAVEQKK